VTLSSPFTITLWTGTFQRIGWIGDPLAVTVTERFNDVSTGEITVRSDHHRVEALTTPGTRVTVDYGGRQVLSGPVRSLRGDGPGIAGTVTAGVEGDFRLLQRVLGWPTPGSALTSQTTAYDVRTGPAETVLKGFVTANAITRLGLPVAVVADQGRGATIKVQTRFHTLAERLLPAVEEAGLRVSIIQGLGGLVVEVFEPVTYPHVLSEASGVVRDWSWSVAGPTSTRVIAGDQGEATARSFTTTVDTARETEWRDVIETFIDARDTNDAATVDQRRADALAEGAPKRGLRVELAESAGVKYGERGLIAGCRATLGFGFGATITDTLREAVLSWTTDDGFQVTPVIGERSDDPSAGLGLVLRRLVRAVRHLGSAR
jgi:hypothetical protein